MALDVRTTSMQHTDNSYPVTPPCKADDTVAMFVQLSPDEQKQVLGKRRGNTLSRRSILKSYHPTTKKQHNAMHIDGVNELRQAKGMPVYTMGTANLRGLRRSCPPCCPTLDWYNCVPNC